MRNYLAAKGGKLLHKPDGSINESIGGRIVVNHLYPPSVDARQNSMLQVRYI